MRDVYVALALCALAGCASAREDGDAGPPDARTGDDAAPDAEPDAAIADAMPIDGTVEARSFTDDAAGEFVAAATGETAVEAWGAVAPVAYYTGGLLARGSDTDRFTDGATATWAQVQGYAATGRAAIAWKSSVLWANGTPAGLGLTSPDDLTEWLQGEIWLEAGSWTFSLLADDHGFVEIAAPGTTAFTRVLSANWSTAGTGVFTASAAGWYPFRVAVAEQGGNAEYTLQFQGPGVAMQPIPRERFRARVDDVGGLVEAAFDDARGAGDFQLTIDGAGPGFTNWGEGNPADLGVTASDTFSVRWTGQFRVDVAGAYVFRYATDDGQRLWIDGIKRLDTWSQGAMTANNLTGAIDLAAGWHDLVIEATEQTASAAAWLTVEAGPDLVGQALPVARLRPVEGRADRIAPGVNHTDVTIPAQGTATAAVAVTAPAGALVTAVDVSFTATHASRGEVTVKLRAPSGTETTLVDYTGTASGSWSDWYTTTNLNGLIAAGTWTLVFEDATSGNAGTILDVAVTPHYAGGEPPIPLSSWFESSVRDLGAGVTSIDGVTWTERLPAGSDIAVRVRTCAAPTGCGAAPWSDAMTTPGATPAIGPARYLQYRVELTSDGDHAPALDSLRVDYHVVN